MNLADIRWIDVAHSDDERGTLTAIDEGLLPFNIRRIFYMHRIPVGSERGVHAHRFTQQGLIAAAGSFAVDTSDGANTRTFVVNDPNRCLYIPAMIWTRLYDFDPSTVALVLCDRPYIPDHVIRDWDEFQRLVEAPRKGVPYAAPRKGVPYTAPRKGVPYTAPRKEVPYTA